MCWKGCFFGPEILKRVWRLAMSGPHVWNQQFPSKNLTPWCKYWKKYSILYAKRNNSGSWNKVLNWVAKWTISPRRHSSTQTSLECPLSPYKRLALVILGSVSAKECFFFHHNVFCITYFVMYNVFSYELPKVIYY